MGIQSRPALVLRLAPRPAVRLFPLLLVLSLAACEVPVGGGPSRVAVPDSSGRVVPFTLEGAGGAAVVVPVSINGGPERPLVLDTGATLTCLDRAVADSLDLPARPGVSGFGAGVGGAGAVGIVRADSVRVGGAVLYDLTVCTLDLSAIEGVGLDADGLLGLNALREFRVGIDFDAQTLTLDPR